MYGNWMQYKKGQYLFTLFVCAVPYRVLWVVVLMATSTMLLDPSDKISQTHHIVVTSEWVTGRETSYFFHTLLLIRRYNKSNSSMYRLEPSTLLRLMKFSMWPLLTEESAIQRVPVVILPIFCTRCLFTGKSNLQASRTNWISSESIP